MRLKKLVLSNFKGIKSFTLDADEQNVSIFGDNGTGKTTIVDAFLWLWTGKDSANKADFEIKTLDADGNPVHFLEHFVEGVFCDPDITLKRVYSESWVKTRGTSKQEFKGHITDFFVDGVPCSKKDYERKIAELTDEKTFKLLSNPRYFNEFLKWDERRKILLAVCGDVPDNTIFQSDLELATLPSLIGNHSMDDFRKIVLSRRSQINAELEKIPVRIDEVTRNMPDNTGLNEDDVKAELETINKEKEFAAKELLTLEAGGSIAEKEKRIAELKTKSINDHNARTNELATKRHVVQVKLDEARLNISSISRTIDDLEDRLKSANSAVKRLELDREALIKEWKEVNSVEFAFVVSEKCQYCGQDLPTDQIETARETALQNFNKQKAQTLERISQSGKAKKTEIEKGKAKISELEAEIEANNKKMDNLLDTLSAREAEFAELPDVPLLPENPEIAKLKAEIEELKTGKAKERIRIETRITELNRRAEVIQSITNSFETIRKSNMRIEELKDQEKKLSEEFEKLAGQLYLTEQFIRAKVRLLESNINKKFVFARFKLFDIQINGGISECCECTINGVPYGSNLNDGARTNANLDIINTLSEFYGFSMPIFIDNAESVTKYIATSSQMIKLVVSEPDKQLRVERN